MQLKAEPVCVGCYVASNGCKVLFRDCRYATKPRQAKPSNIMAQVEGSGIAEVIGDADPIVMSS